MADNDFTRPDVLTSTDREIISQGLNAQLRERTMAYEIAAKVALSRPRSIRRE